MQKQYDYRTFKYTVDHDSYKLGSFIFKSYQDMAETIDRHLMKRLDQLLQERSKAFLSLDINRMNRLDRLIASTRNQTVS